jgi:hypothetical protein
MFSFSGGAFSSRSLAEKTLPSGPNMSTAIITAKTANAIRTCMLIPIESYLVAGDKPELK